MGENTAANFESDAGFLHKTVGATIGRPLAPCVISLCMTEGLLHGNGTTPQALARQLPLHRGAKSRTCFVGGTPVCIKSAQICRGDSRIARSHQSKGGRPMVAPTEWREPCAHRRASPALSPLLPLLLLQSFWKGARGKLLYTKVSPAFFLFYLTFRTPSQARRWRSRDSRSSYPCRSRT